MTLLTLRGVTLGYGGPPLLEKVDFDIQKGERVCLLGLNGAGKSTLMKLIGGELTPDEGEVMRRQGLRVARLAQEVPRGEGSVFETVAGGLGDLGSLVVAYHRISRELSERDEPRLLKELEQVQQMLEAGEGWRSRQRIESVISRLQLGADDAFGLLSGGLKRRVMLARALVCEPDLLLLDEPTNHLDLASIDWLEQFLLDWNATLLFVTHDRSFLRKLATRIVEVDRGRLSSWPGDYDTYLRRKEANLEAEAQQNALFDKRLAQEETWIRQGIKARRTRNEGRVRALERLRDERRQRRERTGRARLTMSAAPLSGKVVVEATDISHAYDGRVLIRDFSTTIFRGDKIGIIGPNGSGKTTLLQILLGRLTPQGGTVRFGMRLQIAYFDQHRERLDEEKSVLESLELGSEQVTINGQSRHVVSYLQDFLFAPQRIRVPVRALSGGERNRLLLARLFLNNANVLVMDEPTNDLDVETLELLEERLVAYGGTLLLVSHDRTFLNNVVTSTLAFEGDGRIGEYVGGFDDWLRQRPAVAREAQCASPAPQRPAPRAARQPERGRKLSYHELRELERLPGLIESLEGEQLALQQAMTDPAFYRQDGAAIAQKRERLAVLEEELHAAYARWEALEALKS